jgi:DNA-directed RNA polymerase subunit M/transcription elongation factor TFIIS
MLDTQNQGPQCTACGSPMRLTAIEPGALGQDLRTFTCPKCKRVQRHVIESTVTEAWIEPKQTSPSIGRKNREDHLMDQTTRCSKCGKRMVPVVTVSGRTDLQCISCDDPAVKWAESPLTAPQKPIVAEPV